MSKTTLDLSTLSLADGTHSVAVKAKADGFKESELSNAVSYTQKSSSGYYMTFANVAYDSAIEENVYIRLNGEGDWIKITNDGTLLEYDNVQYFQIYYEPNGTVSMALLNTDGGYPDMEDPSLSQFDITSATSASNPIPIVLTHDIDAIVTVFATSAFKQVYLMKDETLKFSAIAAANRDKIYTVKSVDFTYTDRSSGKSLPAECILSLKADTATTGWIGTASVNFSVDTSLSSSATAAFVLKFTGGYVDCSGFFKYIALEGDTAATASDFASFTASSNAYLYIGYVQACFAKDTLISTRNGDKKVQDLTYDDDILVWNFDEGKLDYAKPIFLKQEQTTDSYWRVTDEGGKTVNLVGSDGKSHRLYNKRTHTFDYPQDIPECKCEQIEKPTTSYNILTAYHFNCFANGILTSKRYSNMLYPITDEMKYDKTVKHANACKREQFDFLTDEEFEKLRLSEMEYSDEMREEVKQFFSLKQ